MDMNYRIKIDLVYSRFLTRYPCHVCGGCTSKVEVLAEGRDDDGDTIRVCETCLKAGDINARLERHAVELEAYAKDIRALIGRLQVPTYQEWQNTINDLHYYQTMTNYFEEVIESPAIDQGDEFSEGEYFADPHTFA